MGRSETARLLREQEAVLEHARFTEYDSLTQVELEGG